MNIDDWRKRIDEIDQQLIELLNQRSRCALEIGRLKRLEGTSVYQPEREREIMANALRANAGPLSKDAVRRLFERIVDEGRTIEERAYREAGQSSAEDE